MMKYKVELRENDFDLFLYDSNHSIVFFVSKAKYDDVHSDFVEPISKHYLVFLINQTYLRVHIDLPMQDHFDLLESLRIFND